MDYQKEFYNRGEESVEKSWLIKICYYHLFLKAKVTWETKVTWLFEVDSVEGIWTDRKEALGFSECNDSEFAVSNAVE